MASRALTASAAIISAVSILTGCAASYDDYATAERYIAAKAQSDVYDQNASFAKNILRLMIGPAANRINESDIPKPFENNDSLELDGNIGLGAVQFSSGSGLPNAVGIGLGLSFDRLLNASKNNPVDTHRLLSFVPAENFSSREAATVDLFEKFDMALRSAAQESDLAVEFDLSNFRSAEKRDKEGKTNITLLLANEKLGCPVTGNYSESCKVLINSPSEPRIEATGAEIPPLPNPKWLDSLSTLSYRFDKIELIFVLPKNARMDSGAFITALSKRMPEQTYLFVNSIGTSLPYVTDGSSMHFFRKN